MNDTCMLSNFNHVCIYIYIYIFEIDAYSTQWMDETHMRHIDIFVLIWLLYILTIPNYDICMPIFVHAVHIYSIGHETSFPNQKSIKKHSCGHETLFHNFPIKLYEHVSFKSDSVEHCHCRAEAVMHKYRLLSKKGLGGYYSSHGQSRPIHANQEPCYCLVLWIKTSLYTVLLYFAMIQDKQWSVPAHPATPLNLCRWRDFLRGPESTVHQVNRLSIGRLGWERQVCWWCSKNTGHRR